MKYKHLLLGATLVLVAFSEVAGQAVWVDMDEVGYWKDQTEYPLIDGWGIDVCHIPVDSIVIPVHISNANDARSCISNGYLFTATGDVTWKYVWLKWNRACPWTESDASDLGCFAPDCLPYFDLDLSICYFDEERMPCYTEEAMGVGLVGLTGGSGTGLPADFNDIAYTITLWEVEGHAGDMIVMDSSLWEPDNYWTWCGIELGEGPTWNGPHRIWIYSTCSPCTDVSFDADAGMPTDFSLNQNYPNPFNPTTTLAYDVPRRAHVKIAVYNILGQPVRTLVNEELAAGSYTTDWDGTTDSGDPVSSGVYLCKMQAGEYTARMKMMMLR